MTHKLLAAAAVAAPFLCLPAVAQDQTAEQQSVAADECLQGLQALGIQMQEDGYWLAGYRDGWGWRGYGVTAPAAPPTPPPATTEMTAPWDEVGWEVSPGYQIRVLYSAANILGTRGDEAGCQAVLAELRGLYDGYATQLADAGIEPGQVTDWRQERIVAATPVTEMPRTVSVDRILGTEMRNLQDEYLGSIEDVVLDSETGGVAYVIVSHGGFLGIGTSYAVVPWERLRVTQGFDLFVLDAPVAAFENAPGIDPNQLSDPAAFEQVRMQFDQYWDQPEKPPRQQQ